MTAKDGGVLVVRLDGAGDVLLAGPAIRAVVADRGPVTVLAGPQGAEVAGLLPGVKDVLTWRAPWVDFTAPPVRRPDVMAFVDRIAARHFSEALILTSFHQSSLPIALLLRMAGVRRLSAISNDYPGSLLDVRHQVDERQDVPEPERALSLAAAAGYKLPDGDDGRLALRGPLPSVTELVGDEPYVVAHPGVSVPARRWPPERFAQVIELMAERGRRVVVTGAPSERVLTAQVVGRAALDLGGRTGWPELAAVLAGADAVVVGNTGPAHLAAAVGTPVVSLFAPVVPAARWGPYGVPHIVLGDQAAPCRGSRARQCPVPGHPCLADVTAEEVADAVEEIAHARPVREEARR